MIFHFCINSNPKFTIFGPNFMPNLDIGGLELENSFLKHAFQLLFFVITQLFHHVHRISKFIFRLVFQKYSTSKNSSKSNIGHFRIINCFEKTIFSNSYFRKIGNFGESATKKYWPKFWNSLKLSLGSTNRDIIPIRPVTVTRPLTVRGNYFCSESYSLKSQFRSKSAKKVLEKQFQSHHKSDS